MNNAALVPTRISPALVNRVSSGARPRVARPIVPSANIWEDSDGFHFAIALPGVSKDAIDLTLDQGVLTLKAETPSHGKDDATPLLAELGHRTYERRFSFPKDQVSQEISARYDNGMLLVTVPKSAEARPKRIEVK